MLAQTPSVTVPESPLSLYRVEFEVTAQSPLVFPAADHGFKGSAWHGRTDHCFRRHPLLSPLRSAAPGAASHWWPEAPEDRTNGPQGPFTRTVYPAGEKFPLTIVVAGVPLQPPMVHAVTEALAQAGHTDTTATLPPQQAALRLAGTFSVRHVGVQAFPLQLLQPPACAASQAAIELHCHTMLRLDDGKALQNAFEQLQMGHMQVPGLALLVGRTVERCTALGLQQPGWLLSALQQAAADLQAQVHHIQVAQAQLYPWDFRRTSAHAGRADPMGGYLGRVLYSGPAHLMAQAMPILQLATWLRLGRKTALGAGRIAVRFIPTNS